MMQAHRDPTIIPEDPRMRSYWKYHVEGSHRIPREGLMADHYFGCAWCDPSFFDWETVTEGKKTYHKDGSWSTTGGTSRRVYRDGEVEVFRLPQPKPGENPMDMIRGRIG